MSSAFNNALLVAKSTADLCNMCKYAGEKEESINDDMNSLSKELANFSSVLVTQMKEIAVDRSTENQRALTLSENSFTVCLDKIEYIFKNPEYSGQNIVPSMKAVALQKPILDNCTTSIQEARNLVLLCSTPSPINLEDITVCIARLCKSTFNISNLLNESSPASADFNAVQDILAESKKEINIAFEKLQQGEKLVDSGVDLTTFNKSLASVVQVVDELLASSESPDVHAIQQSLAELSQRIELVRQFMIAHFPRFRFQNLLEELSLRQNLKAKNLYYNMLMIYSRLLYPMINHFSRNVLIQMKFGYSI
jgi:hypothetical protein